MQSIFLAALLVSSASGLTLRTERRDEPATVTTPEDVKAKWAQMDDFLETMFTMACKWYHGKDINGEAAEKLKQGELTKDNYDKFVKGKQTTNLQDMDQSCGMITANGKKTCRSACIDRWGSNMAERDHCDESCIAVYDRFSKECSTKLQHLETVYSSKLKDTAMKKQCYEGWCPDLPQVWMKDVTAAKDEVDTSCTRVCTPSNVNWECKQSYNAEVDFFTANAATGCHDNATVQACYNDKAATAKSSQQSCSGDGNSTCSAQLEECKTKAQTDNSPQEALSFCENRFKQCGISVFDKCDKSYKKALESGKSECLATEETTSKGCIAEAMAGKEEQFMANCKTEKSASCKEECKQKCKVDEMQQCLSEVQGEDGTKEFCTDFWQLLSESSEVDPATGNPIVMISTKGKVTKK